MGAWSGVNPGSKLSGFGSEKPPINYTKAICQEVDDAGWRACEPCTSMWSNATLAETLLMIDGAAARQSDLWSRVISVEDVSTRYKQQQIINKLESPRLRVYHDTVTVKHKVPDFAAHIVTTQKVHSGSRVFADRMNAVSRILCCKQTYCQSELLTDHRTTQ